MQAMRIHTFDGNSSLVLEDAPLPKLNDDDVLIRVHAAGVNPIDWKVCAGTHPLTTKMELPLIPGWDVSGVVEAVGSHVTDFKVGDAVFAKPDHFRQGAYAEFIAVRAKEVALKPESLSHVEAASLPLVALTTWQSFAATQLSKGQRILIHGAAGGIGSFAVQLAKTKGAYVVGTGSANNKEFILALGADEYIEDEAVAAEHKVGSALIVVSPSGEQLADVAKLVEAKQIKPIVSTVLPLSEALEAHELNKSGHTRGKIVLELKPE